MYQIRKEESFTLIELLVVIGILAILTAAVIIILNPAEYLKQTRDVTRMNDLGSINQALNVLESQGVTNFGLANTVYVSIPNADATCATLGLPTLPTGWYYHCAPTSTLQNVNGTGWIPVDFSSSPTLSFSNLPIDPINSTSTGEYYTYVTGGSWELTSLMESNKYQLRQSSDGGIDPAQYEVGSNKTLSPFAHGLIGYWKFSSNGSDSITGISGTVNGGTTYIAGKGGGQAANFNGSSGYVDTNRNLYWLNTSSFSMSLWINPQASVDEGVFGKSSLNSCVSCWEWDVHYNSNNSIYFRYLDASGNGSISISTVASSVPISQWTYVVFTYDPVNHGIIYINGSNSNSVDGGNHAAFVGQNGHSFLIGNAYWSAGANKYFNGYISDLRFYSKALSASEVQDIYNSTK